MITRYNVWLDGEGLQTIDPSIIILDIQEQSPQTRYTTAEWAAGRDGTRFIRETRQTASVTVTFQVREYDVARRKTVTSDVAAWARRGRYLEINDRPDQRLCVRCTALPTVKSALKWTDTLTVTFTAYEWPYWESYHEESAAIAGGTPATLHVPGNGPYAYLSGDLTIDGTASVKIAVGDQYFDMRNVSNALSWGYENGLLYIRSGDESVMAHRTTSSSDNLTVKPGSMATITVTSTAAVSGRVYTRGCYE